MEDPRYPLAGKVAIVTGGTQGPGEATARLFGALGAAGLLIVGRNAARGERVAAEITEAGTPTRFLCADLVDLDACRAIVPATEQAFGALDILVNCAGISDRANILETTPELFDRIFAVNVRAPFFLMQDSIRLMRKGGEGGAIVSVASMAVHGGPAMLAAYSASKGALATLTRNTANALLPESIRVNAVAPGWMNTPGEDAVQKRFHDRPDGWRAEEMKTLPLGRFIEPEELAEVIAFLSSGRSGLMTGAIIDFDQRVTGCAPIQPRAPRIVDPLAAAETLAAQ